MYVRTGEKHGYSVEVATDPANREAFKVGDLPRIDFAAKALADAQEKYFLRWPEARNLPLIWTIEGGE
jgi:hypothetical protein